MKNHHFLILFLLVFALSACGGESDADETAEISTPPVENPSYPEASNLLADGAPAAEVTKSLMDNFSRVSDAQTGVMNEAASREFVDLAVRLSQAYPTDTAAALPLYRGAEVVRALNDPAKAAEFYERVFQNYPSFSRAPEALFMLGFTYDEDLGQLEEAEKTYLLFIEKFPNHGFADDSKMLLDNLGKSDEEILRGLTDQ